MKKFFLINLLIVATLLSGCGIVGKNAIMAAAASIQHESILSYHNFLEKNKLKIEEIEDFALSEDSQSMNFKIKNITFSSENKDSTFTMKAQLFGDKNLDLFLSLIDNMITEPTIPMDKKYLKVKKTLVELGDNDGENLTAADDSYEIFVTKIDGMTTVRAVLNTD